MYAVISEDSDHSQTKFQYQLRHKVSFIKVHNILLFFSDDCLFSLHQRAIEKLHYLLKKVSSSKDSLEKHVSIFKRSLVEHWDLLSILENWRSRVHDLTMTPSGYGKRQVTRNVKPVYIDSVFLRD